jgi:hypothetical protein
MPAIPISMAELLACKKDFILPFPGRIPVFDFDVVARLQAKRAARPIASCHRLPRRQAA